MDTQSQKFPITGREGSAIDLEVAAEWTGHHRQRHPKQVQSHFFGNEIIDKIRDQEGCKGLRIYYANSEGLNGWQKFIVSIANFLTDVVADAHGVKHVIITGVSNSGQDQLPPPSTHISPIEQGDKHVFQSFTAPNEGGNTLGEQALPCPGAPGCPQNVLTGS